MSWSSNVETEGVQFPNLTRYLQQWGRFTNNPGLEQQGWNYLAPDSEYCRKNSSTGSTGDYCNPDVGVDGAGAGHLNTPDAGALCDYVTYQDALNKLRYAAKRLQADPDQRFFLVMGVRKPHLNWRAPKPYLELYDPANVSIPLHKTLDLSIDPLAWVGFPVLEGAGGVSPYEAASETQLRQLRRHYYAAVSWADYAAGRVLSELDKLGLAQDTLVVAHADHGWHLGEYAQWEKRTLFELGTRIPLMVRAPWLPQSVGRRVRALAEAVDIYATVLDLAGVPQPTGESVPIDSASMRPLFEAETDAEAERSWPKPYALSVFPRCLEAGLNGSHWQPATKWPQTSCLTVERTEFDIMGYAMRTDRWRYVEWRVWQGDVQAADWSEAGLVTTNLFDHVDDTGAWTDPDRFENVNLAQSADPALLRNLSVMLRQAFSS